MVFSIVLIEGLLAVGSAIGGWTFRHSKVFWIWGGLIGMTWLAFLHGFSFGILQVERRPADPALLAAFGFCFGLFMGLPFGLLVGGLMQLLRRSKGRGQP
jgi:hypothetical protein